MLHPSNAGHYRNLGPSGVKNCMVINQLVTNADFIKAWQGLYGKRVLKFGFDALQLVVAVLLVEVALAPSEHPIVLVQTVDQPLAPQIGDIDHITDAALAVS